MSFFALSALINGLTSLILAAFVFSKNRKATVNRIFTLFCLSAVVWSLPYFLWQISKDAASALFWCRGLMAGAIFIPILYLHFVLVLLEKVKENKRLLIIIYIFALISLASDFTPLFVKNVEPALSFAFWPKPGIVFHTFLATWFLIIIYTTYLLVKKYRTATGILRDQIRYILIGMTIGYIGGSTNYLLWYGIPIKPYGNILASVYVGTTAYAIIRHRLMDIKIVARRSTVYLSSILVIIIPAAAILYLTDRIYPESTIAASLAALILGVTVFPAIRNFFYRLANKYFFSSLYDSSQVISSLTDKLRSTLEPYKIYYFIADALKGAFHSKAVGLLTFNEKSDDYLVQYNDGFDLAGQKKFPNDRALQAKFAKQNKVMVVEEIKKEMVSDSAVTVEMLKGLGVEILAPLNVKDKTIGLIALGAKESRDMYNDEDLRVLETVGAQAAISIENALLYEETKNFTITLKQEVEKATAELRAANEELKKLDQAKSDFISIASHQLRTPLSSIKGFVSMMLEGTYGEAQGQLRQKLEDVYDSNERLIKLVDALLDLSHMEGGKMEFNFTKVNFSEMLASVVEELKVQAEKKKLNFEFAKPKENYFVRADEQKLRQVVLNLIDNAIKYTEKGEVKVWLGRTDGSVEFSVKDTGLGMTQDEIANLFQKFVRGPNAPRLHAEGAGIGLYVAKLLMEAHKGQVRAESAGENKGSTFFVKLPEYSG
jgi:signal transduction histidine kinase